MHRSVPSLCTQEHAHAWPSDDARLLHPPAWSHTSIRPAIGAHSTQHLSFYQTPLPSTKRP